MTAEHRSEEEIRGAIAAERAELAAAVETLRGDVRAKRRPAGRAVRGLLAALGALVVWRLAARRGLRCCRRRSGVAAGT